MLLKGCTYVRWKLTPFKYAGRMTFVTWQRGLAESGVHGQRAQKQAGRECS